MFFFFSSPHSRGFIVDTTKGTYAEDMYENGNKVGSTLQDESEDIAAMREFAEKSEHELFESY